MPRPQPIRAIALRHRTCVQLAVQLLLVAYPVMALSGCGAEFQERIVTTFFDDVKAPPPKRKLRADISRENEQLKAELAEAKRLLAEKDSGKAAEAESPAAEKAKSWPEVAKLLPKVGESPDWTAAIKANIIAPRPGIDPKDPEQAPLDLDLELATSSNRLYFAFFPHDAHTQWLSCGNCHPSIYPLKQQGEPAVMTMAKISAGESCGVCHGTVAFSTTACVRCHPSVDGK